MVEQDQWITSENTAKLIGITMNNLRQIQFRGNLKWEKREGRKVFYSWEKILVYIDQRNKRQSKLNNGVR